jgi:hypothetical protein
VDAIETVSNIDLDQVHGAVAGISVDDGLEEAIKGFAELHAFSRGERHSIIIDSKEAVINDCTRTAVPLRYDSKRADAKVWEVTD